MIYAIIVIYNGMRYQWIQKCFDSLLSSTVPCQIVAIDNASSDESVNFIQQNYPQVHLICNTENKGFGGANNQGLEYALSQGGEYFFLLNQDAYTDSNTLEELVNHAKKNKDYGIISPLHLTGKGDALDYMFSRYIAPEGCKNLYSDFVLHQEKAQVYESGFICAAAWLVTKNALEKVGGFSPTFFHYAEDNNYVHRLLFKGLKIGVLPTVKIYHDRENRPHAPRQEFKPNEVVLKFSNPNISRQYIDNYINQLRFKITKNKILRRNSENKILKQELKLLYDLRETIITNLEKSKSSEKYLFLNVESAN